VLISEKSKDFSSVFAKRVKIPPKNMISPARKYPARRCFYGGTIGGKSSVFGNGGNPRQKPDTNNGFPLWPPLYLPSIFLEKRCKVAYNTEKAILFP
jgi:hypothetical protein